MRGRLINPFLAEIAQLDTVATAADPDGAGPLTSGYDDDFREVVRYSNPTDPDDQLGLSARKEKPSILVPCQVEDHLFDAMRMFAAGDIPEFKLGLVFHFRDLENMGLVDTTTGRSLITNDDRLVAIRRCPSKELVQSILTPPGLYATEPRSASFGLSGGERNLLIVTFEDREQGLSRAAS